MRCGDDCSSMQRTDINYQNSGEIDYAVSKPQTADLSRGLKAIRTVIRNLDRQLQPCGYFHTAFIYFSLLGVRHSLGR